MNSVDQIIEDEFHHPYKPYTIQLEFMRALYNTIENKKIGIYESPTGTGKSLSLLCGSLTWLEKKGNLHIEIDEREEETNKSNSSKHAIPDWVIMQDQELQVNQAKSTHGYLEKRLNKIREKNRKEKLLQTTSFQHQKDFRKRAAPAVILDPSTTPTAKSSKTAQTIDDSLEEFLVSNDVSLHEENAESTLTFQNGYSSKVMDLLHRLVPEDEKLPIVQKIYFSSRTHSQLRQFVQEIQKLETSKISTPIRVVSLASRKNLCINPKVQKLSPTSAVNEKCIELQGSSEKCPYLKDDTRIWDFRDEVLAEVMDIEDMVVLGQKLHVCPYYGAREAVNSSQIVTLPYPLLLQESARNSLNLPLKDNICIIDEAHNIIDAICSMHSSSISYKQVCTAEFQLEHYFSRFNKRLNGINRMHVRQLIKVVGELKKFLEKNIKESSTNKVLLISSLFVSQSSDQVNLHHLIEYLSVSKLARKVDGYSKFLSNSKESVSKDVSHAYDFNTTEEKAKVEQEDKYTPVLMQLESFLSAIANPSPEGKLFYEVQDSSNAFLKYMLLDPSKHFQTLTDQCRSVTLAGGTMSPLDDFIELLFSESKNRIDEFSCGHIVPKENVLTLLLSKGPSQVPYEFSYQNRTKENLTRELGRTLVNFTSLIPDGVVAFFPSFSYLQFITKVWKDDGTLERLQKKKQVFIESKDQSENTLKLFDQYSESVESGHGGLLFCVIGGRLSEGINFSDRLGRAVIVVGMPFPNAHDIEWQTKVAYVEEKIQTKGRNPKQAAQTFYENTCLRAVNQSIGRAIRHRNDYACILLLDHRYNRPSIRSKLPGWLQEHLEVPSQFGNAIRQVSTFFRTKKQLKPPM
ncbi:ATP-dependent DNA helicase Chl1 [Schizosaccharomyces cryophilus OY26]|uniref:ATP-dependent DNA helicase CHL1 n=1 Tax=Schizosaccharomyces cryophilus (strain OY26 / ATCC MYA-4695 / CBS 11777 / NBRC 106824 / NRRL Y48691) TaxID=653667 RepID=S9W5D9_SCHCR|nr:ATP-dependent DNA helicase Chl1 [Schizosaccharomyces cryophilus OY26]EPY53150.1 ATP-dependent DNA helicase Chl1 [Schizosaccharomyces cryophilus OY26]